MNKAISAQMTKRPTPVEKMSEVKCSVPITSIHKVEADGVRCFIALPATRMRP